jgi:choline dehydrogenase-like flavoprotein
VITSLPERGGDLVESADVCVIGSGAGGAVAAAELAEGGRSVVVLEQGPHWTARDFSQREEQMLPRLFEEGGLRQTRDGAIQILQGRSVGGSTVHNLCYCLRTPDPILRLWREEHGLVGLTPEALEPSFRRVERGLGVKPIREDEVNELNRLVRRGAEKLGYSGFVTRHNREGCVKSGYCLLGCSYDAKQSMLITYVPRASAAGARIFAGARVERIEAQGGRATRVLGHAIEPDGTPRGSFEIAARAIVLAAGAINSPDLLLRSGLANGSGQVGENLHLHPAVAATGFFDHEIHAYRGIPQSYYIDEFIDLERDPRSGVVLMPIIAFPVMSAATTPGFGRAHSAWMRQYARSAGLLVLLHDRSAGRVRSGQTQARPLIDYSLEASDAERIAEGLVHCAEVLFAAGARQVLIPYRPEPLLLERGDDLAQIARRGAAQGTLASASVHPQSTCRMGADPGRSVVGAWGECHEVEGLFVADMSVFPTSLGAPPQITTAMLADRTAHHILAEWKRLAA